MPRRDPFADKRRTTKSGRPKQATKQIKRKIERTKKRTYKAIEEHKVVTKELAKTERELEVRKQLLELAAKAPSPAELRKIVMATFMEADVNPIQEAMAILTDENSDLTAKQKADLWLDLCGYFAPKPKTLDLQANMQGSLQINVVDFSKVTQKDLKESSQDPSDLAIDVTPEDDSSYDEFLSPEEQYEKANPPVVDE